MISYELAKKLKESGFKQTGENYDSDYGYSTVGPDEDQCYDPTLSELIEACGTDFRQLILHSNLRWQARFRNLNINYAGRSTDGRTPEEAVAELWLTLNKK